MSSSLLEDFHLNCTKEYNDLLKEFNILFYGYGCKKALLTQMFKDSIVINSVFLKTEAFITSLKTILTKYIFKKYRHRLKQKDIFEFMLECDKYLHSKNFNLTIVVLNFSFEYVFLQKLKNIRIVATIENVFANYTSDDIYDYNFIYRDLTTFIPYEEEILDITLQSNALSANNVINIANCVSNKSKKLFIEILKNFKVQQKVSYNELLKIGKRFLITKIVTINDLLSEFYDHKVLKNGNNEIVINLTDSCVKAVIKHYTQ